LDNRESIKRVTGPLKEAYTWCSVHYG